MNITIKNTVKNIFKTNTFEAALELTRNLRGEYIAEYGVKSWNALVAYYKKANIQPEASLFQAAEPEVKYEVPVPSTGTDEKADPKPSKKELKKVLKEEFDKKIKEIDENLKDEIGGVPFEASLEAYIALQDEYLAKYGMMLGDKNWRRGLFLFRNASKEIGNEMNDKRVNTKVSETASKYTPSKMMKQYEEMKKKHPDVILLFRVGDFYETFSEDAISASEILGITLTRRANGSEKSIELAGFPHHALDTYLPKLVRAGKRVAICEQLEDPKMAKVKEVVSSSINTKTAVTKSSTTQDEEKSVSESVSQNENPSLEEECVEYMLYQNDGEKVDWYGHFVNYKGLKVGESGMMVRMNNLGVGMGKVLATASMTMKEIGIFHKCYAYIRQSTASDNRRVVLFKRAFNNLQTAMRDPKFATLSTGKAIADFVLNYNKED